MQWQIYIVKFWTRPPTWGSKFFQFHAVFGKIWQNRMLAPPLGELAPPPRGNSGSATAMGREAGTRDAITSWIRLILRNVQYQFVFSSPLNNGFVYTKIGKCNFGYCLESDEQYIYLYLLFYIFYH